MPGRAFSCVASTSGSLLILSGLSGAGSGVRTAPRSCCFSPTHSLTKCCGKKQVGDESVYLITSKHKCQSSVMVVPF